MKQEQPNNFLESEKLKFRESIPKIEKDRDIKILLAFVRGSYLYGTSTVNSDVDITFVYQQPTDTILRGDYLPQMNVGGNDIVGYEVERFLELLRQNNPNILEALDIHNECLIYKNPVIDEILVQELWVSKLAEKTILGYAQSQVKKATGLEKNMNNPQPKERKSILDFCYIVGTEETSSIKDWAKTNNVNLDKAGLVKKPRGKGIFGLYPDMDNKYNFRGLIKDEESTQLRLSLIPEILRRKIDNNPILVYYNQDGFEIHCKQHKQYWQWMDERNEERHTTNESHGKNYDSKNMMHLFRLLDMAFTLAFSGELRTRTDSVDWLLEIRRGEHPYDKLIEDAEWLKERIKLLYSMSSLPDTPDLEKTKDLLLKFRKHETET